MPICIQVARSPDALRSLFELRHRVYVDQEGVLEPTRSGAVVDLYDALPTTTNLCAVVEDEVVGGVRITLDSHAGLPADDFFDFRAHLPDAARLASCGMMCLTRDRRDHPRIIVSLLRMCMYWAVLNGRTHLCGPVSPAALRLVQRIGFEPIGEPFTSAEGLPSVPVAMDIEQLAPDFVEFVQRQEVGLWMENFERWLFEPGDVVVQAGEPAHDAWLVLEGRVEVRDPGTDQALVELRRGHVFGELALLSPVYRTHTVVATAQTDAMVLTREQFQDQLRTSPEVLSEIVRSLGNRFEDALRSARGSGLAEVVSRTGRG